MQTSQIALKMLVWVSTQGAPPAKRGLFGISGMFTDKG